MVMNTTRLRALPACQRDIYEPGESVDVYKPPVPNDASDLVGPAASTDTSRISRRHAVLKHIHLRFEC